MFGARHASNGLEPRGENDADIGPFAPFMAIVTRLTTLSNLGELKQVMPPTIENKRGQGKLPLSEQTVVDELSAVIRKHQDQTPATMARLILTPAVQTAKYRSSLPWATTSRFMRNRSWYPFQLAFVLLNLPGITDLGHSDRTDETAATADLLWFPTGGGKTEAYLGLTAYTIGLRRLQGEIEGRSGEHGIAVLMRYTLRLLTLQQFQRAGTLICACEAIRREKVKAGDKRWGIEPFRVGLWVGQRTTPNTTTQSEESIKQDHGHYSRATRRSGFRSARSEGKASSSNFGRK